MQFICDGFQVNSAVTFFSKYDCYSKKAGCIEKLIKDLNKDQSGNTRVKIGFKFCQ